MTEEHLRERFERLMSLLEKLVEQRQEIHVHVHTDAEKPKDLRSAIPYSG